MPDFVLPPQHYGSMMPTAHNDRGRRIHPQDGWRTPTVEDDDHPAHGREESNLDAVQDYFHDLHRRRFTSMKSDVDTKSPSSDDDMSTASPKTLPWRVRIKHVTWAWFTLTMATGGIANVLHQVPFRFPGLRTIGIIFFLVNILLYLLLWAMIITRFTLYPTTLRASFRHPTESLFIPAVLVSFGTILINIVEYASHHTGPWLTHTVLILFWFDTGLAFSLSITIYLILWSTQSFTIARMTPIWIFPAYPLLIIGPHAAQLSSQLTSPHSTLQVIVAGFTMQGIGFLVSLTIYSAFVYRLMTQKLPAEPLRPGMFVSVGPSAFTVSGTIGMAANLRKTLTALPSDTYMSVPSPLAASILVLIANWSSLWLWGLAYWFFFVSLLSNIVCFGISHRMPFAMTWFSFIFPQTALITSTFVIAKAFDIYALNIVGCVMTCLLILVWMLVVSMMVRAVARRELLWPGKGEDKIEGGFKMEVSGSSSVGEKTGLGGGKEKDGGARRADGDLEGGKVA